MKHETRVTTSHVGSIQLVSQEPIVAPILDTDEDESNHLNHSIDEDIILNDNVVTVEAVTVEEMADVVEDYGKQQVETNFQCAECADIYETESQVHKHMKQHQEEESICQCEECGLIFITDWQLENHMRQEHRETVQFECNQCENEFESRGQLWDHIETVHRKVNNIVIDKNHVKKELELLIRRHEALKEKYEEVVNKNKEYSKKLFSCMKENTELKNTAEKDADTLADTLNMNQVLVEELKVKDDIIKANEKIRESEANIEVVEGNNGNKEPIRQTDSSNMVKCDECDWYSPIEKIDDHMLIHTGQFVCGECKLAFKTRSELKRHEGTHTQKSSVRGFKCISCDKDFQAQHSFKQHLDTKHNNTKKFPVGHPGRYVEHKNIACTKCDKLFYTGSEVEEHMTEHRATNKSEQNFQFQRKRKVCRYFKNGFCFKGEQCAFSHIQPQNNDIQVCRRGQGCKFFYQNRCKFFHENAGVHFKKQRACKFGEKCWNFSTCEFSHDNQGFRFSHRTNRPPQNMRDVDTRINNH